MTVTNGTAWGAESDKNGSQARYYDFVGADTRMAPKAAWSNLNPTAGLSRGHRQVVGLVWWLPGLVVVAIAMRYKGYRYPIEVIGHAVWLYHRFALSLRDVRS